VESAAAAGLFDALRLTYVSFAWLVSHTARFPQTRGGSAISGLGQRRCELADLFTES
jgi:hypothetical protein